jgi:hypothetical protein
VAFVADFPNVVVTNGTGANLEANIAIVTVGASPSSDLGLNYVYDFITVVPGRTYAFTVDVKRLAGTTGLRLDVKWRKPDGSGLSVVNGPAAVTTVGDTSTLTYTGVAPAGAGHAIVCVRYIVTPVAGEKYQASNPGLADVTPVATVSASVVAGDGEATVSWVPSDASAFGGYTVQADKSNTTVYTMAATDRSKRITGLVNGVEHTFTVVGLDGAGNPKANAVTKATPVAAAPTTGTVAAVWSDTFNQRAGVASHGIYTVANGRETAYYQAIANMGFRTVRDGWGYGGNGDAGHGQRGNQGCAEDDPRQARAAFGCSSRRHRRLERAW